MQISVIFIIHYPEILKIASPILKVAAMENHSFPDSDSMKRCPLVAKIFIFVYAIIQYIYDLTYIYEEFKCALSLRNVVISHYGIL